MTKFVVVGVNFSTYGNRYIIHDKWIVKDFKDYLEASTYAWKAKQESDRLFDESCDLDEKQKPNTESRFDERPICMHYNTDYFVTSDDQANIELAYLYGKECINIKNEFFIKYIA
jgi:hypothetical protein